MKKTKFTYREWHYTCAHENLFDLDKNALAFYREIVKGAP